MAAGWLRRFTRPGQAPAQELPPGARDIFADRFPWWPMLTDSERERLLALSSSFLASKRWEAARGFELTDEIRLLIAGQAALMALELDDDAYSDVGTIIVHRSTVRLPAPPRWVGRGGGIVNGAPTSLAGQAHQRGPVVIAWGTARRELARPGRGRNVVFHELAHKLDMVTPLIDGTPHIPDDDARRRWVTVCTAEYERVQRGDDGPLRSYAATNPAEFFAVATEVFFDRPAALAAERPELYDVLRDYYRQDPAARERRHAELTASPSP